MVVPKATAKRKPKEQQKGNFKKAKKLQPPPGKQERQSQRKHADIVTDGKRIWNQLRLKSNTKEQQRALVEELMPLVATDKAQEIALQHDGSRLVQSAIQFGNDEERKKIVELLCAPKQESGNSNTIVELSKSQYAHFVVLKIFKYCHDKTSLPLMVTALKGHISKLAVHATASRVVESLFDALSPQLTAPLKQEFYGPHFSLFATDTLQQLKEKKLNPNHPTLAANLEIAPDKKEITLDFVRNLVHKGMEKQLYGFSYFQQYLLEYLEAVSGNDVRTLATTAAAADHCIHLLSTRAGTKAVALLTAYGTAKERKRILKSLKGYCRSGLMHRDAYLAILRLVQLTDDTVSIQKNLIQELLTAPKEEETTTTLPLLEIALSDTASKLFLLVLVDDEARRNKFLDPYEREVLSPNPVVVMEDGQEVPTSKKDPDIRRKELLKYLREPWIELCSQHANELLRSIPGSAVLREVYRAFRPAVSVVEAILNACDESLQDEAESSIFEDAVGHRSVKNIILTDAEVVKEGNNNELAEESFAQQFCMRFGDKLTEIARSNRGAFVVGALCEIPSLRKIGKNKLESSLVEKLSKQDGPTAGFKALLKAVS